MTSTDAPPRLRGAVVAAVALGGAAGSVARVAVGEGFAGIDTGFPWTTLGINVVGCALLALLPALAVVRDHHLLAPMLGTGVLGGFTTLSAWSGDTHALLERGRPDLATGYALGTLLACLAVVALVDRLSTPAQRARFDQDEGDL
jgi:CrcB protein